MVVVEDEERWRGVDGGGRGRRGGGGDRNGPGGPRRTVGQAPGASRRTRSERGQPDADSPVDAASLPIAPVVTRSGGRSGRRPGRVGTGAADRRAPAPGEPWLAAHRANAAPRISTARG